MVDIFVDAVKIQISKRLEFQPKSASSNGRRTAGGHETDTSQFSEEKGSPIVEETQACINDPVECALCFALRRTRWFL